MLISAVIVIFFSGFIPPVTGRYLQLFLPVLQFLSALSSTQGPQLKEARSQVSSRKVVT